MVGYFSLKILITNLNQRNLLPLSSNINKIELKIYMLYSFLLFASLLPFFIYGQNANGNKLNIEFKHIVDSQNLTLDTVQYFNKLGQPFYITKFKYYISNIELINDDGKNSLDKEEFLINEEEFTTKNISIKKIKTGEYNHIRFIVGVDSIRNCSGAQSGTLDPIHAMFWTWNTGYIFLKLEGFSSASSAPKNIFEYHIGGYKEPTNCIQSIDLKFKSPLDFSINTIQNITIQVNIAELLKTPTDIDFKVLPSVTDTKNAPIISNNYRDMFTIE